MTTQKEREKLKPKTEKPSPPSKPAERGRGLSDEALEEVSGGLNPQPLPPGIDKPD